MHDSVILKTGKEWPFLQKHLWIFSGAIAKYPKNFQNGNIYPVCSSDKKFIGYAYFNEKTSLAGRFVSFEEIDPMITIKNSIKRAIDLRKDIFSSKTNAFRLINAEGDFLPGLIVDNYNNFLVLQSNTLGIDILKNFILECLVEFLPVKGIYEKSLSHSRIEEGLKHFEGQIYKERTEETIIEENNHKFVVSWETGQKTGFFLDQRENRFLVEELSINKNVLNCFCYTGGFSIYAMKGKAKNVVSIDYSDKALKVLRKNFEINNIEYEEKNILCEDAFNYLTHNELNFDLIILDPPSFVKKRKDLQSAAKAYYQMHYLTFKNLTKRAYVLTCSCSYYFNDEELKKVIFKAALDTKKNVKILQKRLNSFDHPINLFHPESSYLKSYLLEVY